MPMCRYIINYGPDSEKRDSVTRCHVTSQLVLAACHGSHLSFVATLYSGYNITWLLSYSAVGNMICLKESSISG